MEELIITRDKQLVGGISKIKIYINEEFVGFLKNGENKKFRIPQAKNLVIKARYFWLSSEVDITGKSTENVSLKTRFYVGDNLFMIFGILINVLAILAAIVSNKYLMVLFLFTVTFFIYLLMFKKNSVILETE